MDIGKYFGRKQGFSSNNSNDGDFLKKLREESSESVSSNVSLWINDIFQAI